MNYKNLNFLCLANNLRIIFCKIRNVLKIMMEVSILYQDLGMKKIKLCWKNMKKCGKILNISEAKMIIQMIMIINTHFLYKKTILSV